MEEIASENNAWTFLIGILKCSSVPPRLGTMLRSSPIGLVTLDQRVPQPLANSNLVRTRKLFYAVSNVAFRFPTCVTVIPIVDVIPTFLLQSSDIQSAEAA
jgi:hypothetical protein